MKSPLASIRKRLVRFKAFPQVKRLEKSVFLLDPQNWIDNRLLANVPYEQEQLEFVQKLALKHNLTTFIDIGANFGLYSICLGQISNISHIVAFEPVKRNFNQLCANIFANKLDSKITAMNCALGDKEAQMVIHIDPHSTGISRLNKETANRNTQVFKDHETISVQIGDNVLTQRGIPLVMKIDVEGHTFSVLSGLNSVLNSCHGAIQVEMDDNETDVDSYLKARDWQPIKRIQGDVYYVKSLGA